MLQNLGAAQVGFALHRAYKWEAEEPWEKVARVAILVGGSAYLAHLVRDAFTAKSLPFV